MATQVLQQRDVNNTSVNNEANALQLRLKNGPVYYIDPSEHYRPDFAGKKVDQFRIYDEQSVSTFNFTHTQSHSHRRIRRVE